MRYTLRSIRLSIFLTFFFLNAFQCILRQLCGFKKKNPDSKEPMPGVTFCFDELPYERTGLCHMCSLKIPGCLNTVVTISYNYDLAINHSFHTNASLTQQIVPICSSKPECFPVDSRSTCVLHLTGFSLFHGSGHVC